jgi:plastocyanin
MKRKVQEYIAYPLIILITLTCWLSPAEAVRHIIKVSDYTFTPATLSNVNVGDTVRWVWMTGYHTTFSTAQSIPSNAATWNNPINSSALFFDYKVTVSGTYGYACGIHGSIASGVPSGMSGSFSAAATATGIQDVGTVSGSFSIYPRPANDLLTVRMNSSVAAKGQIIIYDIQGKEVQREEADLIPGNNSICFFVGTLNKGQYFIEVYNDKKRLGIQKILKD